MGRFGPTSTEQRNLSPAEQGEMRLMPARNGANAGTPTPLRHRLLLDGFAGVFDGLASGFEIFAGILLQAFPRFAASGERNDDQAKNKEIEKKRTVDHGISFTFWGSIATAGGGAWFPHIEHQRRSIVPSPARPRREARKWGVPVSPSRRHPTAGN